MDDVIFPRDSKVLEWREDDNDAVANKSRPVARIRLVIHVGSDDRRRDKHDSMPPNCLSLYLGGRKIVVWIDFQKKIVYLPTSILCKSCIE